MNDEWFWAALICGVPFLIFGAMESYAALRRRRLDAVARRPKGPLARPTD